MFQHLTVDDALSLAGKDNLAYHNDHLNPRLTSLLRLVGADRDYTHAAGMHVWDRDGRKVLDFLAGFGALNLGHNHPYIWDALTRSRQLPNLLEGLNPLEAALAHNLSSIAPGHLSRAYFASSGAEVVDAALKLAVPATGRTKFAACQRAFHGRSIGAISLMDLPEHRAPFERLLADVAFVPFGDADQLESALKRRDVAAFFLEPIQAEGGIRVPPEGYLASVRELCTRYGTLLVADEIQTGLGRTGAMFVTSAAGVEPDVLLLGKALGGGLMPISALLTGERLFRKAGGATPRTPFHHSTFGGNPLACVAAIATMDVLEREKLIDRSAASGRYLLNRLRDLQRREPFIADVRGSGLLAGIELAPAAAASASSITRHLVNRIPPAYYAGVVMMELLTRHDVIAVFTLNQPNVLRLEPPLIAEQTHLDYVVDALESTLHDLHRVGHSAIRLAGPLFKAWRA
jgi:putrescine aminotransferase